LFTNIQNITSNVNNEIFIFCEMREKELVSFCKIFLNALPAFLFVSTLQPDVLLFSKEKCVLFYVFFPYRKAPLINKTWGPYAQ